MKGYRGVFLALFGIGIYLLSEGLVYFFEFPLGVTGLGLVIASFMLITGFVIHTKEIFKDITQHVNKDKDL